MALDCVCVDVLHACRYVHQVQAQLLRWSAESAGAPGTRITHGCELLCGGRNRTYL